MNQSPKNSLNENDQELEKLRSEFENHRLNSPTRHYPPALRKAVINALNQGVEPYAIRTVCKISTRQLRDWKRIIVKQQNNRPAKAKVLQVINDCLPGKNTVQNSEEEIEIRIGHWHLIMKKATNSSVR